MKRTAGLAILLVPLAIYLVSPLITQQGAFWLDWVWKAVVVALLFHISMKLRRREKAGTRPPVPSTGATRRLGADDMSRHPAFLPLLLTLLVACTPGVPKPPPPELRTAPEPPPGSITAVVRAQLPTAPPEPPWIRSATFPAPERGWMVLSDGTVLTTADGGQSWHAAILDVDGLAEEVRFASPDLGWVLTDTGLWQTRDGGQTWTRLDTSDWPARWASFIDARHGWLQTPDGALYATGDGGRSWTEVTNPCPPGRGPFSFISPGTGWILCGWEGAAGFESKRLYRTDDGGATWRLLAEARRGPDGRPSDGRDSPGGLPAGEYVGSLQFLDEQTGWWTGIRAGSVMITHDGGETWRTYPHPHLSGVRPHFLSPDVGYLNGIDHRGMSVVVRTADGGTNWTQVYPTPTPTGPYYALDPRQAVAAGLIGDPGAILRTADGGHTWQRIGSIPGETVEELAFMNPQQGWAFTDHWDGQTHRRSLYRTADGGATWQRAPNLPGPPRLGRVSFVDEQTAYLWDGREAMLVTRDTGQTLAPVNPPPGAEFAHGFQFVSPGTGWAARDYRLHATDDGARTWNRVPLRENLKVQSVALTPDGRAWAVAVDTSKATGPVPMLIATRDGGQRWTQYDVGDYRPNRVQAGQGGSLWFFDGRGGAALVSHDGGQTWQFGW